MVLHTLWGTFHANDLEVIGHCSRCGRPRYSGSIGNQYPPNWPKYNPTNATIWVCYPCLLPEED